MVFIERAERKYCPIIVKTSTYLEDIIDKAAGIVGRSRRGAS
jgi:hypothetical protein